MGFNSGFKGLNHYKGQTVFNSEPTALLECTLVQALRLCTGRTARKGSKGVALLFHDHGTRRGWGVSVTPQPLFTPGKDPVPIVQEAGWAHNTSCVLITTVLLTEVSCSQWHDSEKWLIITVYIMGMIMLVVSDGFYKCQLKPTTQSFTLYWSKLLRKITYYNSIPIRLRSTSHILIYIQQDATLHSLFYLETALHISGVTTTHHQERKQLYLQHLVFVRPLLLPAAIAAGSSNGLTDTRCCRYSSLRFWWWVVVTPETCRAVSR